MHVDPDLLALHALGEDVLDPTVTSHLHGCPGCRSDVVSLQRTVTYARVAAERPGEGTLSSTGPSPQVWSAISAELGLSTAATRPPPARTSRPRRMRQHSRWRSVAPLALAACVVAATSAAATAAWLSRPGSPPESSLAARLAPLAAGAGDGQAEVLLADGDQRTLTVSVAELPTTPGYHEVWLIDLDTSRMVSLGAIGGVGGAFTLPAGLDLAEYDVVDISDEPIDGDPLHSGVSLLRGTLA